MAATQTTPNYLATSNAGVGPVNAEFAASGWREALSHIEANSGEWYDEQCNSLDVDDTDGDVSVDALEAAAVAAGWTIDRRGQNDDDYTLWVRA